MSLLPLRSSALCRRSKGALYVRGTGLTVLKKPTKEHGRCRLAFLTELSWTNNAKQQQKSQSKTQAPQLLLHRGIMGAVVHDVAETMPRYSFLNYNPQAHSRLTDPLNVIWRVSSAAVVFRIGYLPNRGCPARSPMERVCVICDERKTLLADVIMKTDVFICSDCSSS